MEQLLSPGIKITESAVTPAVTATAAQNGVATLSFSTKGPVNKLTRIRNVSEFTEVFGEPVADFPLAHIMARSVLLSGTELSGTDVYFMRLASDDAKAAKCPVIADFAVEPVVTAIKANNGAGSVRLENGIISMLWKPTEAQQTEPAKELKFRIELTNPESTSEVIFIECDTTFDALKTPDSLGNKGIISVGINTDFVNAFEKSGAKNYFDYVLVNEEGKGNVGIIIKALSAEKYVDDDIVITSSVGYYDNGVWYYLKGSVGGTTPSTTGTAITSEEISSQAIATAQGEFNDVALRSSSTLSDFEPASPSAEDPLEDYYRFNLVAAAPGSGMNGVRVVKTTVTPSAGGEPTWTVSVYEKDAQQPIETRTGLTPANFLTEMSKFSTIAIIDAEEKTGGTGWTWVDGTWELGTGLILNDGSSWQPSTTITAYDGIYKVEKGTDGYPTVGGQYSESKAVNLYVNALKNDEFVNTDEYSFSILATPGIQSALVQSAAINVCATRGDAIYLADIPIQYCKNKQGIDECVAWANGNSAFQTSYCAIYYGWFAQTNPYASDKSILCPASCFIAPKMVALDQSVGEFYAPAGITRGNLICSDWLYSPDQKDRDKLVGGDNVINPISYSSTRGVTIMAQKTTDRTTSPLNRVGIRRMTNAIKRNLRSMLVTLLFEPNNETARARARSIVDNIMSSLRTRECIESYDINVVSGTGANRNDLNVYLSFAPYGLIEKIYVYLSITDAGVEVTEEVA